MNHTKMSSLLVTGEPALSNALNYLLSVILKHEVKVVDCFDQAEQRLTSMPPVDVMFFHAQTSEDNVIPIIKLAKSIEVAPVVILMQNKGADLGAEAFLANADDVVAWPCSLHELAIRLHVRCGRSEGQGTLPAHDTNWETEAYIVDRAGLTTVEAQVMRVLYSHDGEIVSRDDLSYAVDARPWRYGDRKFDVHVANIRKKLSGNFGSRMSVSTIRSCGYQLFTHGSKLF